MLLLALLACRPTAIQLGGPVDSQNRGTDTASSDDSSSDAPPIALIAAVGPATAGIPLTLDGSSSYDPDGDALTAYAWACDDGQTASGSRAALTFDAGVQTCTLLVTADGGLTGTTSATFTVSDVAAPRAQWTVLVFMNGDNDLEEWALGDMNELEQVGSTDDVNLIVQLDRSPDYSRLDGDWTGTRRFRAEKDSSSRSIGSPVLEDLGETDAGDPSTVIDFAEWGIQRFPADHYMLILWDHGWGWSVRADGTSALQKGISWDESTDSDISPAAGELLEIVDAVDARIGGKLDVLGMDACTMANWEIAQQLRDDVNVYLASQDYEDSDGYDYTGFADLTADPSLDAAGLASSVALHFHEIPDSTMSAIDLGHMNAVTEGLNNVADALLQSADPAAMLTLAAADAQGFDGNRSTDHDLADMLDKLAAMDATADGADPATAAIVAAAVDARTALNGAIIANYNQGGAVKNANGLSLYSPVQGRIDNSWFAASWASETLWGDFLKAARAP
jgi:hypothetical protein